MWKKPSALLLGLFLLLAGSSTVYASGFALIEQSVSGLGNAFSGGAASAEDATTIFFNPAGMTRIEGQQVSTALHVIVPSAKFKASTATNAAGNSLGTNNSGDGGKTGVAPNFYYTNQLNEKLAIGIGINAPFGLSTEYDKDWVGRYHAVESDVMTVNINPALAYKVNEKLSIGAGLNAQYIEATLSSMADVGLTLPGNVSSPLTDVLVENNADDWSFGYNLGLLYEFNEATRIGFAYRSEIKHKLKGDTTTQLPAALAASPTVQAAFANQGVNGKITLPASASLSIFHQVTDKLALMADVTWTEWSSFKELTLNFEGALGIGGNSSTTTTENWDDTWRYSAGATYQATEELALRTGIAFDETPISDEYRTPRIPGEDRLWLAIGAGYKITENFILDVAYTHLFVSDSKMQKTTDLTNPNDEDNSRGNVIGEFENSVDIASAQLSYKF